MQAGQFREDLYYRLNVVSIEMPPLRERKDDIVPLASSFIRRFSGELKKKIDGLETEAQKLLMRYNWPGNIRELENTIERAMLLAEGRAHRTEDLRLGEAPTAGLVTRPGVGRQDSANGHSAGGYRTPRARRGAEDVQLGAEGRRGAALHQPARDELQDQDARDRVPPRAPRGDAGAGGAVHRVQLDAVCISRWPGRTGAN